MQRGIVIGVGNLGCAAMRDLPDDPNLFQAFIAIHHTDYIRKLWPNDGAYRVPRYKITDPCDHPDVPADPVFVEYGLNRLDAIIGKLLREAPDAPILLSLALSIDGGDRSSIELDENLGSAVLRHFAQSLDDPREWLRDLRETIKAEQGASASDGASR